jgi:hypothetical protein
MKKPRMATGRAGSAAETDAAANVAVAALNFLAADRERFERFLALTGLGPESLRAAARDPGFLVGVIEHVTADQSLLLALAADLEIDPQDIERAGRTLVGRPGDTGAA